MRLATLLLAASAAADGASDFFVAVDGGPAGDGSKRRPWDLETALAARDRVRAGDRVWIEGGVYELERTVVSTLEGSAARPIVVRAVPGRRVRLDCAPISRVRAGATCLEIRGAHAWYWGLEIFNSRQSRWSAEAGAAADPRGTGLHLKTGPGVKLINLVVHDVGQALFESQPSGLEIYGLIAFHCGWEGPDRSHGPGIYIRNRSDWPEKRIEDAVVFENYRQGLQGYGTGPNVFSRFRVVGSAWFNNGVGRDGFHRNLMFGNSTDGHADNLFQQNYTYFSPPGAGSNSFGVEAGCRGLRLLENVFAHGPAGTAAEIGPCPGLEVENNLFYGQARAAGRGLARTFPSNRYDSTRPPDGMRIFVRPNRYDPRRAHLILYNWAGAREALVDLSPWNVGDGARVRVRSVQDLFGEGVVLSVRNGMIRLPLSGWAASKPIGSLAPPPPTLPEFGVFVLQWESPPLRGRSAR